MSQGGQEDGEESAPAGEAGYCTKQPNLPGTISQGAATGSLPGTFLNQGVLGILQYF